MDGFAGAKLYGREECCEVRSCQGIDFHGMRENAAVSLVPIVNCHPETRFGRRISRNASVLIALSRLFHEDSGQSPGRSIKFEIFRKIR